jgi:hypothetical protein
LPRALLGKQYNQGLFGAFANEVSVEFEGGAYDAEACVYAEWELGAGFGGGGIGAEH